MDKCCTIQSVSQFQMEKASSQASDPAGLTPHSKENQSPSSKMVPLVSNTSPFRMFNGRYYLRSQSKASRSTSTSSNKENCTNGKENVFNEVTPFKSPLQSPIGPRTTPIKEQLIHSGSNVIKSVEKQPCPTDKLGKDVLPSNVRQLIQNIFTMTKNVCSSPSSVDRANLSRCDDILIPVFDSFQLKKHDDDLVAANPLMEETEMVESTAQDIQMAYCFGPDGTSAQIEAGDSSILNRLNALQIKESFPEFHKDPLTNSSQNTDIIYLKSPKPKFLPVDVTQSHEELYVTSQYSDEVSIFKNDQYIGELKPGNFKTFSGPRNVLYLEIGIIIVLDDLGFHFFNETTNKYIGTSMAGKGWNYRGLGYFTCLKDNNTYLTSLHIHSYTVGTKLCVFKVDAKGHLSPVKDIIIEETKACIEDPMCRFVSVYTNCHPLSGCLDHVAYVTAMEAGKIYSVDIVNSISHEFVLKGEHTPNNTFVSMDESICSSFSKPTGICVDITGNVTIVDKQNRNAKMYSSKGVWLQTFDLGCQGIGLHVNPIENAMYLASFDLRKVLKYRLKMIPE